MEPDPKFDPRDRDIRFLEEPTIEETNRIRRGMDLPPIPVRADRNGVEMAQAWTKGGKPALREKMKELFPSAKSLPMPSEQVEDLYKRVEQESPIGSYTGPVYRDPLFSAEGQRKLKLLAAAFDKGPEAYEAELDRLFPKSSGSE